ncbi:Transmembrane protein [Salix suchowensis]|nr:Transmembrane protein [Salix suchowensis]
MGSPANLCSVLSESHRIIKAHSRHFLALSVLFILPPSFFLSVYPTIQNIISQFSSRGSKTLLSRTFFQDDPSYLFTTDIMILSLLFSLLTSTFSLFAQASITYSVIHGFYGRPVRLWSSIKSAFTSFFPLLITGSFVVIILLGVLILFALFLFFGINGIQLLGFEISVSSPYFIVFSVILGVVLVFVLLHLELKWLLAPVIVVAESSWGLESMRRSDYLMKRMKGVALSMLLFFGFFSGLLVITISFPGEGLHIGNIDSPWKIWPFVVRIVVTSALPMVLQLYSIAAFAVLYMDCKAMHGELVLEIVEEFAGAYVSLPFDDGKTPHFNGVVHACYVAVWKMVSGLF